ncbi:MAG: response regulator [Kiloniellales bacterium]|nr:response regulator [Kiloniellales bacterium]
MGAVDLNMPVLIVDDYKTMLRTMGILLKRLGFENIDEANDGHEALEKLRDRPYSLVISGWDMRPMSGLDLVRLMRANGSLDTVQVVMVAAENGDENVAAAKEAGAAEYIVKPFCASTLKDRLTPILGPF